MPDPLAPLRVAAPLRGAARRRRLGWVAVGLAVASAGFASAPGAARGGERTGPAAAAFTPIVSAWRARDADLVAAAIPEKDGRLDVFLLGTGDGRVSGRYTRKTAETELEKYFGALDKASLEDVTPAATPRATTRTYDYTYRPKGGEQKTTRLAITLTDGGAGKWWLAKIAESARPR